MIEGIEVLKQTETAYVSFQLIWLIVGILGFIFNIIIIVVEYCKEEYRQMPFYACGALIAIITILTNFFGLTINEGPFTGIKTTYEILAPEEPELVKKVHESYNIESTNDAVWVLSIVTKESVLDETNKGTDNTYITEEDDNISLEQEKEQVLIPISSGTDFYDGTTYTRYVDLETGVLYETVEKDNEIVYSLEMLETEDGMPETYDNLDELRKQHGWEE